MDKLLPKNKFPLFLTKLQAGHRVIGPTRKGGGTATYSHAVFAPINKVDDLELGYKTSMLTHKTLLFPDNHPVYEFRSKPEGVELNPLEDDWAKETVLLGVHPCDLTAIRRLDRLFLEDRYQEPTYKVRRESLTIVGLTCVEASESCFCNVVQAGPDADQGCDILLTDLGDAFFVRPLSPKGEQLVTEEYFSDAGEADQLQRASALAALEKQLPGELDLDRVIANMKVKYDDELWQEFTDACLSCGACNMVCPTCHCFNIVDRTNQAGDSGKRVLVWDPCHFERFSQMAGDVNLRSEKSARYKHRLYDKFLYDPQRHDDLFCVGCGRCIAFCPSHIDILAALGKLER
jgi:ferredoxin